MGRSDMTDSSTGTNPLNYIGEGGLHLLKYIVADHAAHEAGNIEVNQMMIVNRLRPERRIPGQFEGEEDGIETEKNPK